MPACLTRRSLLVLSTATLAGCATGMSLSDPHYSPREDGGFKVDAVPAADLTPRTIRTELALSLPEPVGGIVVDPYARFLYFVGSRTQVTRYGIAVGWQGRNFSGQAKVGRKAVWPPWTPTPNMIRTNPELYAPYAKGLPGGPPNPLGARALYLYQGGRDTFYRIHGTQEPSAIGKATVAGCIRLFNQDAIELFERVATGALVKVRSAAESRRFEGEVGEGPDGRLIQLSPPAAA